MLWPPGPLREMDVASTTAGRPISGTESMPRVLVTPTILRNTPGLYSETLLAGGFEVVYPPEGCDTMKRENLLPLLAGVDAMLASVEKMSREVMAGTKLRAIARLGVGYDSIDT